MVIFWQAFLSFPVCLIIYTEIHFHAEAHRSVAVALWVLPPVKLMVWCCYWSVPANQEVLQRVEVQYETLAGWNSDTSAARSFAELPENAQKYVRFVEEFVGVPGKKTHLEMIREQNRQIFSIYLELIASCASRFLSQMDWSGEVPGVHDPAVLDEGRRNAAYLTVSNHQQRPPCLLCFVLFLIPVSSDGPRLDFFGLSKPLDFLNSFKMY